jgi:hypothetical protein
MARNSLSNQKHFYIMTMKTILLFFIAISLWAFSVSSSLAADLTKTDSSSIAKASPTPSSPDTAKVDTTAPADPFAYGDFTWLNGNDRQHTSLLDSKYFTGEFLLDANYTASNQHPIDHTVTGSTTLARDNEFEVNLMALGGDFHYDNVMGRVLLQLGTRATVVPRNDLSVLHGQYDLADAYRYFSEAYAGYHFNVWNGINVQAGIFMSYIGLFSYYNAENWAYQPSFTSDNTPWFFNGMRVQIYTSDKLKIEPWITNGWQSYAKFTTGPATGGQILWRPTEWAQLLSNNFYGYSTQDQPNRLRLHTDNSIEIRYYNSPGSFLHRAAFSLTNDIGEETGGGVNGFHSDPVLGPAQFFISGMAYHRLWFDNDHIGWTIGGGWIHNPGRYLVLAPTGDASPIPYVVETPNGPTLVTGTHPFTENPGDQFTGWDCSTTLDWMPNELITWRLEFVHREASVGYFAGPGGVTSPDGYVGTPLTEGWAPDLVKVESRVIVALLCRF